MLGFGTFDPETGKMEIMSNKNVAQEEFLEKMRKLAEMIEESMSCPGCDECESCEEPEEEVEKNLHENEEAYYLLPLNSSLKFKTKEELLKFVNEDEQFQDVAIIPAVKGTAVSFKAREVFDIVE